MPTTTVSKTTYTRENGDEVTQYRTTVPKALAEAFDLGGVAVEWEVESGNKLSITKLDNE
jgi:hypothetical protein